MTHPLLTLDEVWHVGDMIATSKRAGSYEGAGLSISVHPAAWRQIARGQVGGATWLLKRPGSHFLDALALSEPQKNQIMLWSILAGYATEMSLWRWTYWDDDLEEEVYQDFSTQEEATLEAWDDEPNISEVPGFSSTPLLDRITMQIKPTIGTRSVLDLVLPLYAENVLKVDGVWWEERLDPPSYSAPRGVISAGRVQGWSAIQCSCDPDD